MQYRRVKTPGACYFFTVNLAKRKGSLLIDEIEKLRQAFHKVKLKHPFKVDAVVILPDHLHMVMSLPEGDANYSQRWNLIKGCFSRSIECTERISIVRKKKRERGIWQKRFWEHLIRDEKDFKRHVDYIHYNPVKHGYVRSAADWKYSSIHHYIAMEILPRNWGYVADQGAGKFGE